MGYILILNNETFANEKLQHRIGCRLDINRLSRIFYTFNFCTKIINDPKLKDIQHAMRQLEQEDLNNALCLFVVIMTHGAERNCAQAYDQMYSINKEILQSAVFQNFPKLPKILITQACKDPNKEAHKITHDEAFVAFPLNTLRFDSTFEKTASVRIQEIGSLFIQILCDKIEESGFDKNFGVIVHEIRKDFNKLVNKYYRLSVQSVLSVRQLALIKKKTNLKRKNGHNSQSNSHLSYVHIGILIEIFLKNMKRSFAIVIMNGNGPQCSTETKLQNIINNLYLMDVKMAVLVNATSREIRQCIKDLTTMNTEKILDIIFVIEAPRINENAFSTKDGRLDIYIDILKPLYSYLKFVPKNKIIITSGTGSTIDMNVNSVAYDSQDAGTEMPRYYGKKVVIVTSEAKDFIDTFITKLVNERGNIDQAVKDCPGTTQSGTIKDLILSIPVPRRPARVLGSDII